jgi:hypothetical protein
MSTTIVMNMIDREFMGLRSSIAGAQETVANDNQDAVQVLDEALVRLRTIHDEFSAGWKAIQGT